MAHLQVAHLATLLGALGAVLTLAVRGRVPLLAGFVALGLADACLGYALVPAWDLRRLTHHLAGWGLIAALAITVAAVGCMLVRYPAATPVALLVVAPFRLPVQLGDQKAFLLLPFYGVVAGAVVALAYRALRGDELPAIPPLLSFPLALVAVLTSVSFLWSRDPRAGAIALGFFYFPFVAGVAVVARSPLLGWVPRALATTLVAFATVFAAIGLWQAQTRRLFLAPDLEVANAYTTFFRVTSLFKDPSLYGLHLVLAIAVLLVAVWLGRIGPALAVGVIAFLSAGLFFSSPSRASSPSSRSRSRSRSCSETTACASRSPCALRSRSWAEPSSQRGQSPAAPRGRPRAAALGSSRSPSTRSARAPSTAWASAVSRRRASRGRGRLREEGRVAHDTADGRGRARRDRLRRIRAPGRGGGVGTPPRHATAARARPRPRSCPPHALRALALLRRLLREPDHLGGDRDHRGGAVAPRPNRAALAPSRSDR